MCESGRLLSTRLSAYDRLLSGDGVYKLMRLLNGVSKSSYYCSCSRGKYEGSNYCWKHSTSSSSLSMKEIMSKGEQVLESDFPSKCKKVSKVADAKEDLRLMLVVSADLKHRLSEFKRVIVSEESIEAITENICKKESSPSNALCDGEAIIESDKVDAIPQDVSQVPTIEDTSSKAISKVEDIVSELEGSDDEDDDPDCIELTTIGGEILYYEASGNKIYRLDEDCEGVCIGIMEEVLDSNKRACTLNGKDYAIGEELKSGKDVLFRCVITNNVYKRQSKGLKYFGVCRQGADGTCTITKKK
jgi:hypothetical protein